MCTSSWDLTSYGSHSLAVAWVPFATACWYIWYTSAYGMIQLMADGGDRNFGQTGPIHVGTVWVWMVTRNYTCHMSAFRSCCVSWVLSHWLLRSFTDDEDDEDMEEEDVSTKDRKEVFRCVAASMKPSRLLEKASHTRPQQFGSGSTNQQRRLQLKDLKSEVEKTYEYLWLSYVINCYHIISYSIYWVYN